MEPMQTAKHLRTGVIGEEIAKKWLISADFSVLEQNYRKKWGEIDIIAQKGACIHFVEVKAVSYETVGELEQQVLRGTYRPEEHVDDRKLARLARTIRTWVFERRFQGDIQLDVLTVRMVPREKYAVVDVIENVTV